MVLKQKYLTDQAGRLVPKSVTCQVYSVIVSKKILFYKVGKNTQTVEVKFVANTANQIFFCHRRNQKNENAFRCSGRLRGWVGEWSA